MIEFSLEWAYYYVMMLMISTMLLVMLINIIINEIMRIICKVNNRVIDARFWCRRYRDAKVAELCKRLDRSESEEERNRIFDEMREYRDTYIRNRRRL